MSEKFCLKWNDFHSNVSKSFGLFRNEDYLHDVTLVSDDHHQVSAHRLVLSACSEYFKNIFRSNNRPNYHPILCLDGISADDLTNIMDYIYNGEVKIFQENLDRFLTVAQRLKLEGLMENKEAETETENSLVEDNVNAKQEEDNVADTIEEFSKVERNISKRHRTGIAKAMVPISTDDVSEAKRTVQQYIETDIDGNFKCTICGKVAVAGNKPALARSNLGNHIETHLEGLSFSCQLCGKTFRSRNSLNCHKYQIHK